MQSYPPQALHGGRSSYINYLELYDTHPRQASCPWLQTLDWRVTEKTQSKESKSHTAEPLRIKAIIEK